MTSKSDVTIDFNAPSITWGQPSEGKSLTLTLEVRNLKIPVTLHGDAVKNKTKIVAGLRRTLKFFVRGDKLCDAIDFNAHVKLFMTTQPAGTYETWGPLCKSIALTQYTYGVWLNIEEPTEMVVWDAQNVTALVSDDPTIILREKPTCVEFVKSEGGVLFMPHLLALDSLSHQAVIAQRIRRDMWRRTRPGAHFTDYGNLHYQQKDDNVIDLWLGENRLWSVDLTQPFDIIPDDDYFTEWGIGYILEDRSARKRMAEFTVTNFKR